MTSRETISSRPILLMVLVLTPASSHKSFFRSFLSIISLNSLLYDTAIFPRPLTFKAVYKPSQNSIAIIAQGALRVNKKCRLLIRHKSYASSCYFFYSSSSGFPAPSPAPQANPAFPIWSCGTLHKNFSFFIGKWFFRIKKQSKRARLFDELLLCGGERGIRTPVTVFAVNMISNHAPSTARTPLHVCSLTYRSAPY